MNDYKKLNKALMETNIGDSFSVRFQNPTEEDKDSMDTVTNFLLDNGAIQIDSYIDSVGTHVTKYNIHDKIFFIYVWIDDKLILPKETIAELNQNKDE